MRILMLWTLYVTVHLIYNCRIFWGITEWRLYVGSYLYIVFWSKPFLKHAPIIVIKIWLLTNECSFGNRIYPYNKTSGIKCRTRLQPWWAYILSGGDVFIYKWSMPMAWWHLPVESRYLVMLQYEVKVKKSNRFICLLSVSSFTRGIPYS